MKVIDTVHGSYFIIIIFQPKKREPKFTLHLEFAFVLITDILSVESQKGIITIQWCSIENQKAAIPV